MDHHMIWSHVLQIFDGGQNETVSFSYPTAGVYNLLKVFFIIYDIRIIESWNVARSQET
jgi:hypothetical protein